MQTEIKDTAGDSILVGASEDHVRLVTMDRWWNADYAPAQARELAAALLRAADEAEDRAPSTPERDLLAFLGRAGWDGTDMVAALRVQVVKETMGDVATFIRDNINMKGLDFADAEDVAKWLEEQR
ncbi:hypothetical protein ACFY1A_17245 [Streptomyces sp. NPDC001520]|uniref:hypothetical protein n=1 Tax=Streptomyces sp. NPDC001520 TaxID=3364581 RepID=UPI0036AECC82